MQATGWRLDVLADDVWNVLKRAEILSSSSPQDTAFRNSCPWCLILQTACTAIPKPWSLVQIRVSMMQR
jgi:hypothetical protein